MMFNTAADDWALQTLFYSTEYMYMLCRSKRHIPVVHAIMNICQTYMEKCPFRTHGEMCFINCLLLVHVHQINFNQILK